MFEKSLKDKFTRIFDFKKVTYDMPGESEEQECIFIEIDSTNAAIKDGRQFCKVTGKAHVFAQNDKLPGGYFAKRIKLSDLDDTRDLFFYDLEQNVRVFQNIVRRSFSFVYFFNSQYDPETGTITSVEFQ